MPVTLVHFHNLLIGKPACLPVDIDQQQLLSTCDPSRITCPECLRYLRHEGGRSQTDVARVAGDLWGSKGES